MAEDQPLTEEQDKEKDELLNIDSDIPKVQLPEL